jgi:hypothetical protein
MAQIYFHCSGNGRPLPECRVLAVDDLAEARDHAARIAIQLILESLRRFRNEIKARGDKLMESVFDPYRPELHYMRGPGPKWHARHGVAAAKKPVEQTA